MSSIGTGVVQKDETLFAKAQPKKTGKSQAQAIADYDFGVDEYDEDEKVFHQEKVSHACAASVANARMNAQLT